MIQEEIKPTVKQALKLTEELSKQLSLLHGKLYHYQTLKRHFATILFFDELFLDFIHLQGKLELFALNILKEENNNF